MYAMTIPTFGGPEVLTWAEVPEPRPGPGEVLIDVRAAGVNRADLMQRAGHYPPPPGASDVPGLECSGVISAIGPDVGGWAIGDEVCALLAGGGYAERAVAPAGQVLPVPEGVSLTEAAGLPEATCTVWVNVFQRGRLRAGETLLVHGGTSGIGSIAVQLARHLGARVIATSGTPAKCALARDLGAEVAIDYRTDDFVAKVDEATGGRGADVILDVVGGPYLARNVQALATGGRLVVIGLMGGRRGELDLGLLLSKRGAVHATGLRGLPLDEKAAVVGAVREHVWPAVASGAVRVVVDQTVPITEAAKAHTALASGGITGKILLTTSGQFTPGQ